MSAPEGNDLGNIVLDVLAHSFRGEIIFFILLIDLNCQTIV